MFRSMEKQIRNNMIGEIQAFANDYHHHIDGRDVVIVEQLLDFLRDVNDSERP
jgi:cytidylate kinase